MEKKSILNGIWSCAKDLGAHTVHQAVERIVQGVEHMGRKNHRSPMGDADEILSNHFSGFCIDGTRSITRKMSYEGVYIQAPTGAGKTSVQIIGSINQMTQSSLVVHDPSGELYGKTAGYLKGKGYDIVVLNFSDPAHSHSFNPLDFVRSELDVAKLSALLVRTVLGTKANDPFWNLQAETTVSTMTGIVLKHEPKYRNYANVRHVLRTFTAAQGKVDKLFAAKADDKLFADYSAIRALEPKVASSVAATAMAALSRWQIDEVCRATATSSFAFSDLRKKKCAVYVQNVTAESKFFAPLISIFFELLFKELMSRIPDENERDIFLLLEETATLGDLPTLPIALCNLRKFKCGILTAWQGAESVIHAQGEDAAEIIRSNSLVKIFYPGQSQKTCEELERTLGKVSAVDERGRTSHASVMSASAIRTMKHNEALVVCGARRPYKITLTPYYLQPYGNVRANMPPPIIENNALQPIDLIPL